MKIKEYLVAGWLAFIVACAPPTDNTVLGPLPIDPLPTDPEIAQIERRVALKKAQVKPSQLENILSLPSGDLQSLCNPGSYLNAWSVGNQQKSTNPWIAFASNKKRRTVEYSYNSIRGDYCTVDFDPKGIQYVDSSKDVPSGMIIAGMGYSKSGDRSPEFTIKRYDTEYVKRKIDNKVVPKGVRPRTIFTASMKGLKLLGKTGDNSLFIANPRSDKGYIIPTDSATPYRIEDAKLAKMPDDVRNRWKASGVARDKLEAEIKDKYPNSKIQAFPNRQRHQAGWPMFVMGNIGKKNFGGAFFYKP
jgi:hypothetical protein